MDDLTAFLRARLDEDEAAAKNERVLFGPFPETIKEWKGWLVIKKQEQVLAEVAAKRAILDLASDATGYHMQVEQEFAVEPLDKPYVGELILRRLAAVYSGHPDYRPEWKP